MFAAGPAKMTTIALPGRGPPVGVGPERVVELGRVPSATASARLGVSFFDSIAACSAGSCVARILHVAGSERVPEPRRADLRALVRSATTRANDVSTSDGAGRCIPGIFTKPPSGIVPMPYSIPLRFVFQSAGGNPM